MLASGSSHISLRGEAVASLVRVSGVRDLNLKDNLAAKLHPFTLSSVFNLAGFIISYIGKS